MRMVKAVMEQMIKVSRKTSPQPPERLANRMVGDGGGVGNHAVAGSGVIGIDTPGHAVLDGIPTVAPAKPPTAAVGEKALENQHHNSRNGVTLRIITPRPMMM